MPKRNLHDNKTITAIFIFAPCTVGMGELEKTIIN